MFDQTKIIEGNEGNVTKYVFTNPTAVAEAVLYRYPDYETRTVICCSVMSGCPIGCRFCGAGDYFVRALTGPEIVAQVDRCLEDTGVMPKDIKRLQIMFMSMGEPMLNSKGMEYALLALSTKYPNAALLVSTVGPDVDYEWLISLSIDIPNIGLQFSIHESTDAKRDVLIPFKGKMTLAEIADTGEEWASRTGRKPFFNYCAGDDNSETSDARRIAHIFNPSLWNATVSVICERNDGLPAKNDHQIELAMEFSKRLLDFGFDVRVFDPAGQDDIGGGCGQLWFVQEWMKNNPEYSNTSIGFGLPKVHTPLASRGE